MNNVICTWEPGRDLRSLRKPCLITLKFIRNHGRLDVVMTWRNRDILKRMVGNWLAIIELTNLMCNKTRMKPGMLYDLNMQGFFYEDDRRKWDDN